MRFNPTGIYAHKVNGRTVFEEILPMSAADDDFVFDASTTTMAEYMALRAEGRIPLNTHRGVSQ